MPSFRTGTAHTKGNSRGKLETRAKGKHKRTQMTAKKRRALLSEPDVPHLEPMQETNPFARGGFGPV